MPVWIIKARRAHWNRGLFEDPGEILAVAGSEAIAREWIKNVIENSARLHSGKEIAEAAVKEWEKLNPRPNNGEGPQITKWPSGLGQNDPRYPELRRRRDKETQTRNEWGQAAEKVTKEWQAAEKTVYYNAAMDFGLSQEEVDFLPYSRLETEKSFKVEQHVLLEEQ